MSRVGAFAIALGVGTGIGSIPAAFADSGGSADSPGASSTASSVGSSTADSTGSTADRSDADRSDADRSDADADSAGSADESPDTPGAAAADTDTETGISEQITAADDEGPEAKEVNDVIDPDQHQASGSAMPLEENSDGSTSAAPVAPAIAIYEQASAPTPSAGDPVDVSHPVVEAPVISAPPPQTAQLSAAAAGTPDEASAVGSPAASSVASSASDELWLFGNGTAGHPDAGILIGSGFSWDASSCIGAACDGGKGGFFGSGGNGFNGGNGGSAGWFGAGGHGGDGVPGGNGGNGGRGGLLFGIGGNGGSGGEASVSVGAAGKGGAAGAGGLFGTDGQPGNEGAGVQDTTAGLIGGVSVNLPPMPVSEGWSFTVAPDVIADFAADYVASGGDPADGARFFFGDLAVASLQALGDEDVTPDRARLLLGNLAASGYFGGVWLRDNLRDTSAVVPEDMATGLKQTPSSIAIRLFDALATGLAGSAASTNAWVVRTTARASVPFLLALYGYNRGYLEVVLENPPDGLPSMQDSLVCDGFLDCTSTAFPLEIATGFDAALDNLASPSGIRWLEMSLWNSALEGATGAGRSVWEGGLVERGAFSPVSYAALVELSSAYLMVSKAAVLSSMLAYADGDADIGRSSLRLQAGLWIWSGTYFGGLASDAPAGTMPAIVVVAE